MSYKVGSLVVDILANDQVSNTLDKIGNKIGAFGTKSNRLAKNGGGFGFLKIAKWTAVFAVARRFGRTLSNIVQSGADYTETLNLWETAMGSNLNVATEFVNKMNEAYGISEKTLMNAQAIFKNMLGSLGQISDTMAYSLSEGITQMALDYASLYNQTFEQAFTKFQGALAGQVRPIRSVAGYDITENTLYQLYQSLGGTKTMRQLTRTEKQLLSILAIFNQMTASGAVGDLDKTMESFANQSRVMAEAWDRIKTYAGVLLTYLIEQTDIMVKINAVLIYLGNSIKKYVESVGAIKSFGGNIFEETTDSVLDTSNAIDEVKGKLLDFDKFRALSSSDDNVLGLDEKLLSALAKYTSILGNASMKANQLVENIANSELLAIFKSLYPIIKDIAIFFFDINETVNGVIKDLLLNVLPSLKPIFTILKDIVGFTKTVLNVLYPVLNMVFDLLKVLEPILSIVRAIGYGVSVVITGALYLVMTLLSPLLLIVETILKVIETIGSALNSLFTWDWSSLGKNLSNIWKNWKIPDLFVNLGTQFPQYANGASNIDSGTLFIAGEMGKTEAVYTGSNGKTNVANIQQMQTAYRSALNDWWATARQDIPQFREVSRTGIYEIAKEGMVNRGEW